MPKYLDIYEEPSAQAQPCFLCGETDGGHWSTCAFSEAGMSDDDPDADNPEQSAEWL